MNLRERLLADVALPCGAVPRLISGLELDAPLRVPANLFHGDGAIRVALANDLENLVSVEIRCIGAGPRLKMVREAACSGVVGLAEWACYVAPEMGRRT
jgi:hypothetical protein